MLCTMGATGLGITVGLTLTFLYAAFRWRRRKLYQFAAQFRGPREYPLVGSAHLLLRNSAEDCFQVLSELGRATEEFAKIWFGPQLGLFVCEPEDARFILHTPECLEKPYISKLFSCGSSSLFSNSVDQWKDNRKLLNSKFTMKILRSFIPIFNDKDTILSDKLRHHLNGGEFDVHKDVGRCVLDNICATTLGTNLNLQQYSTRGYQFVFAIERWLAAASKRMFNISHHLDFIYRLSSACKVQEAAIRNCIAVSSAAIDSKRKELEADDKSDDAYLTDDYRMPHIFISHLLRLSKDTSAMNDHVISDHMLTLIFAGHETTTISVSTTLVLLAIHQNVQEKVASELREVFYNDEEYPEFELLNRLVYLDMVIQESLRLFPPVPYIARLTTDDVEIPNKNITIPKNVVTIIPIYNIHRDPRYWGPKPDEFNPDHFLPENEKKRSTYSHIPFAAGPRVCLGYKYATLSMKVMLTILLRKYRFNTKLTMETMVQKFDVTLKLGHEHWVSIEPRIF